LAPGGGRQCFIIISPQQFGRADKTAEQKCVFLQRMNLHLAHRVIPLLCDNCLSLGAKALWRHRSPALRDEDLAAGIAVDVASVIVQEASEEGGLLSPFPRDSSHWNLRHLLLSKALKI
jgi:hypothetical protein